jgi:hypothetical protein
VWGLRVCVWKGGGEGGAPGSSSPPRSPPFCPRPGELDEEVRRRRARRTRPLQRPSLPLSTNTPGRPPNMVKGSAKATPNTSTPSTCAAWEGGEGEGGRGEAERLQADGHQGGLSPFQHPPQLHAAAHTNRAVPRPKSDPRPPHAHPVALNLHPSSPHLHTAVQPKPRGAAAQGRPKASARASSSFSQTRKPLNTSKP